MDFNPLKMQEMLAQAQKQAEELQKQMQSTVVEATVGGGAVTLRMNGQKQVLSLRIDPETAGDLEMLQDLVVAAFNEGSRKVDQAMQASLGGLLGGLGRQT